MLDDMYSQLIRRVNYKTLMVFPIILTLLSVALVCVHGIPLGIDFRGGTWIEVVPEEALTSGEVDELTLQLASLGLEDLEVYSGKDLLTSKTKLTIITTSQIDQEVFKLTILPYVGSLYEIDSVVVDVGGDVPADIQDKIASRFTADVSFDEALGVLEIDGFDLDEQKLHSALDFYLVEDFTLELQKKNINIKPVGEILGATFWKQGKGAVVVAYLLIISVIFFAFRDFVPSFAVLLAGTCDALIALGGMSLFGIVLEPASLVALLMLVGYSVDSDILLTTRVLRNKTGTVDDRINNAMKTGLTMTGTTLSVMLVILVVSTFIFQIALLTSIASVLLIGLVGDLATTWMMNAGILKWYVEEKGGKLNIRKSLREINK